MVQAVADSPGATKNRTLAVPLAGFPVWERAAILALIGPPALTLDPSSLMVPVGGRVEGVSSKSRTTPDCVTVWSFSA